jgi:hypothetical protein
MVLAATDLSGPLHGLQSPGIRPEDVFINLIEVAWETWSFGLGEAQYTKD